jgi:hypothetical protein
MSADYITKHYDERTADYLMTIKMLAQSKMWIDSGAASTQGEAEDLAAPFRNPTSTAQLNFALDMARGAAGPRPRIPGVERRSAGSGDQYER